MNEQQTFILDLRTLHCPLALLTAKRWFMELQSATQGQILLSQRAEHQDVVRWLGKQGQSSALRACADYLELSFCKGTN